MRQPERSQQRRPMGKLGFKDPEALIAHLQAKYGESPEAVAQRALDTGYFAGSDCPTMAQYIALAAS